MDKFVVTLPTTRKRACKNVNNSNYKKFNVKNSNQMFLDFGQKSFGETITCKRCNMLFIKGDKEDEDRHIQFCSKFVDRFIPNIKNYKIIECDENYDKIVKANSSNLKNDIYIQDVINDVHTELGSSLEFIRNERNNSTIYLYLRSENNNVCGFLLIESISSNCVKKMEKFRELSCLTIIENIDNDNKSNVNVYSQQQAVNNNNFLGVRLIWVHENYRNNRIASKLINCARKNYLYGTVFPLDKIAFSQPTSDGFKFAMSFCKLNYIYCY